jgi:predicted nuclease of restriction endonuclease-like (RecB) superfamily
MNYDALIQTISSTHEEAKTRAIVSVNRCLVFRNWLIGAYLVEFEQQGEDRAEYGAELLERASKDLRTRGIKGLGVSILRLTRRLFQTYPQIRQSVITEFHDSQINQAKDFIAITPHIGKTKSLKTEAVSLNPDPPHFPVEKVLSFSWTHLIEFLRIEDPWKRAFYENECLKGNWSVRQLQRQIGSLLYERTGLSIDKETVIDAGRNQAIEAPQTVDSLIRDPYILEFTGLAEKPHYLEKDLESALLDHIQTFLLELGNGFCFEARQKRVTIGNEHDYIDLAFYNRTSSPYLSRRNWKPSSNKIKLSSKSKPLTMPGLPINVCTN